MARISRMLIIGESTAYHVMSRTALDGFPLRDVEKVKRLSGQTDPIEKPVVFYRDHWLLHHTLYPVTLVAWWGKGKCSVKSNSGDFSG